MTAIDQTLTALPFAPALLRETYVVGGAVRDLLLGRTPQDWDLVVAGDLNAVSRKLAAALDVRPITLGKPHQPLVRLVTSQGAVDLTPMEGPTLDADLRRRDFTINAMAWDPRHNRLIDPYGGGADLKTETLRRVTAHGFLADPLRLLRAYRLAAQLKFSIEPATEDQIRREAPRIARAAGERVRDELFKLLAVTPCRPHVQAMAESDLCFQLLPQLGPTRGCTQGRQHGLDVWDHTLASLEHLETILSNLPRLKSPGGTVTIATPRGELDPPLLKLACLLHDMGKPACRTCGPSGEVQFYGHDRHGAQMAADLSRRLRLSRAQSRWISHIIRRHLDPLHLYQTHRRGALGQRATVRFFTRNHPWIPQLLLLALADEQGKCKPGPWTDAGFQRFAAALLTRYEKEFLHRHTQRPLLGGKDLIRDLRLSPGPAFKTILSRVEEARLAGAIGSRREALKLARTLVGGEPQGERDDTSK